MINRRNLLVSCAQLCLEVMTLWTPGEHWTAPSELLPHLDPYQNSQIFTGPYLQQPHDFNPSYITQQLPDVATSLSPYQARDVPMAQIPDILFHGQPLVPALATQPLEAAGVAHHQQPDGRALAQVPQIYVQDYQPGSSAQPIKDGLQQWGTQQV